MRFLLNKGAETESIRPFIPMLLYRAIFNRSNEIVTMLLTLAPNVNILDARRAALGMAAEQGLTNIVDKLLKAGANINLKDEYEMTALMYAAREGREMTFVCGNALQDLSDIELNKIETYQGNTDTIKLLLDNGANPDEQNKEGQTALMLAAERGHLATAKVLLASGANINIKDNNNNTALMLAARKGHIKMVQLLKNRSHLVKVSTGM